MFNKIIKVIGLLAISFSAVASEPLVLTEEHCTKAKVIARSLLLDLQQGATQYQLMANLNERFINTADDTPKVVMVYLQVNVSAFNRNLNKGFRVQQVLDAITKDCGKLVGKTL